MLSLAPLVSRPLNRHFPAKDKLLLLIYEQSNSFFFTFKDFAKMLGKPDVVPQRRGGVNTFTTLKEDMRIDKSKAESNLQYPLPDHLWSHEEGSHRRGNVNTVNPEKKTTKKCLL